LMVTASLGLEQPWSSRRGPVALWTSFCRTAQLLHARREARRHHWSVQWTGRGW
jgi:hypothetical protein